MASHIIITKSLSINDIVFSGYPDSSTLVKNLGWAVPMEKIGLFSIINNIELHAGRGAQLVRSAGTSCVLIGRTKNYVTLKLSSGWQLYVLSRCMAVVGIVSNADHKYAS